MTLTQTAANPETVMDPLNGASIIDCDAHFTEPADLWSSRVPDSLRGRVPEQRTVDGRTSWYLDDVLWASIGGNTIRKGREKVLGSHVVQPFDDVDHAAWDVSERLALMDHMGVSSQVVYPNGIGFASNHVFAIEDEAQRTAVLQIYNDFYVDIQNESGGRLRAPGHPPDLGHGPHHRRDDPAARPRHAWVHVVGQARAARVARAARALFRAHVGPVQRLRRRGQLPHRRRPAQGGDGEDPLRPLHEDRPGRLRQRDQDLGRPLLAIVRPSAPPRGERLADVHEQRPHRRQPVHERRVRPVPEREDRLGRERHRVGSVHPGVARVPARRDGDRPDRVGVAAASADRVLQGPRLRDVLVRIARRRRSSSATSV